MDSAGSQCLQVHSPAEALLERYGLTVALILVIMATTVDACPALG
ncbi:hypothetical protein [Kineosporia sp. A_224]|nr:hypothetical protein [Kineosporia sp. A_224]